MSMQQNVTVPGVVQLSEVFQSLRPHVRDMDETRAVAGMSLGGQIPPQRHRRATAAENQRLRFSPSPVIAWQKSPQRQSTRPRVHRPAMQLIAPLVNAAHLTHFLGKSIQHVKLSLARVEKVNL